MQGQRQAVALGGLEAGTELRQRGGDPAHGAPRQRGIAHATGGERRGRHQAHGQPDAGAGIAEIQRLPRAR